MSLLWHVFRLGYLFVLREPQKVLDPTGPLLEEIAEAPDVWTVVVQVLDIADQTSKRDGCNDWPSGTTCG